MEELQVKSSQKPPLRLLRRPAALIIALVAVAAVLRLAFVSADFPVFLSSAQDEVYDAPWYVEDAQYIVQGRQPAYDSGTLKLLWTGYFTAVFFLLGPGVWQGNAGAALLGVACVWLVFLLVKRAAGRGTALIALLLGATNFILVMYSRTPLPYIGACASTMLCLYLWFVLHSKPRLLFIPYVLAVVFAFHLKSVAGLVLPVMVVADAVMLFRGGTERLLRRALPCMVAGAAAGVVLLVEYCLFRGAAAHYVESRYSAYVGETTIMEYVRGLLSMGFESRYFIQMPVAAFLAFLYPVLLARRWRQRSEGELRLGVACTLWMAGAIVAFGLLKYRNLHYFIIMSPAMLILAALCLRELAATRRLGPRRHNLPALLLIIYLSYQVIAGITVAFVESGRMGNFLAKSVRLDIHAQAATLTVFGASWALPLSLVAAAALVGAWRLLSRKLPEDGIALPPGLVSRAVALTVAASVVFNLVLFARFAAQQNYSTAHLPKEISALVGENAKISEHGCALAGYGNYLTTERHGFGFANGRTKAKNPTHLFVNFFRARLVRPTTFADGPHTTPVAVLTVKKVPAILYRLRDLPSGYRMSAYEEGVALLRECRYEQALAKFHKGMKQHPESGVLRRSAGVALFKMGQIETAEAELRKALELLPEDIAANSYIAACLTLTGRYTDALKHLKWMREYYELDLRLSRVVFDYRETLLTAARAALRETSGPVELLETVLRLLTDMPPGLRTDISEYKGLVLPRIDPVLPAALLESPEARKAAAARRQFADALSGDDFESAAAAVTDFSRLRGGTLTTVLMLQEIFPIGSTPAYLLNSLDITGDFIRRRRFYSEVATFATEGKTTDGEKVLAVFDWVTKNVWPARTPGELSGRTPEEIALTGVGGPVETGWLFCTILENLRIPGVLFGIRFREGKGVWWLTAVGCGEIERQWYLFAPDKGLPLVGEDGASVATLKDLLNSQARIPGEDRVIPGDIDSVKILFTAEAQTFLPAASSLEELLTENGYNLRCHNSVKTFGDYSGSIADSVKGSKQQVRTEGPPSLWRYPFHLQSAALAAGRSTPVPDETCVKAKILHLTGNYSQALKVLGSQPGSRWALLRAQALLGSGDGEGALSALECLEARGSDSDTAAYVAGAALLALGRISEAGQSFKKITDLRAALGAFLAEKALARQEPHFTVGQE